MKIIILGAGQIGGTLAEHLTSEDNDITIVDEDIKILQSLDEKLDVRAIVGHAALPSVLRRAGAEDADMVLAVTNSDETNMLACQIAYTLFNTPMKIARVRNAEFELYKAELFDNRAIPIDVLISPEQLITRYVKRLIEYPGALQVLDFANGLVQCVGLRAVKGAPLVGRALKNLHIHMPSVKTRIAAIFRHDKSIKPEGETIIQADDEVFFICEKSEVREVMSEMRGIDAPYKRIMIAGGGNIGLNVAKTLEKQYHIKIIDHGQPRCRSLAEQLNKTVVLCGDAADKNLLYNENIEETDVFCALTNDDETNIMSATLAKRMGARKVMALINRPAYVDLIEGGEIDIAISPQQATISSLLTHIRRGDIAQVHSLRRGAAEAIEAVAHGTFETSKVVGRKIVDLKLPPGTTIGVIVRGEEILPGHGDTVIEADDHVILFVTDRRHIKDVERLFQVAINFF
jgi:trk system potassium uptake protein TrkA